MNKILAFSDLHLDARTCNVVRFDELSGQLERIKEIAVAERVDTVVFCGDACDPDSQMTIKCIERLAEFAYVLGHQSVKTIWMNGNHDVVQDGYGTSTLSPLEWAHDLSFVIAEPALHDGVGFLPYPSQSKLFDLDIVIKHFPNNQSLIFGHLNIDGVAGHSESNEMARGIKHYWPAEAIAKHCPGAMLIGGHYHVGEAHVVKHKLGQTLISTIGSPASFAFGAEEKVEPRVAIITATRKGPELEWRPIGGKHARLKTISFGELSNTADIDFARVLTPRSVTAVERSRYIEELLRRVTASKIEVSDNETGAGLELAAATPTVTAEDGIAIAKQLAKDFATADEALKREIELLTDEVADRAGVQG